MLAITFGAQSIIRLTVLVDTDMLTAEQVLAIGQRSGQLELHGSGLPRLPALVLARVAKCTGLPAVSLLSASF